MSNHDKRIQQKHLSDWSLGSDHRADVARSFSNEGCWIVEWSKLLLDFQLRARLHLHDDIAADTMQYGSVHRSCGGNLCGEPPSGTLATADVTRRVRMFSLTGSARSRVANLADRVR